MGESPYQDLVDAGGLRAVLQAACPDCDIEMLDARGAFGGFVATVTKNDRAVRVLPVVRERMFYVRHKLRTTYLSRVATTELTEVTGSAATWLGGATARELAAAWPVADFVDVADAYESGDRIELRWLRRMYPFTSLYWMSFRPTADEYRVPGPWVRSVGDGQFTVTEKRRLEPGITYDAAEAVRVCVAEMNRLGVPSPEDLRPDDQIGISG